MVAQPTPFERFLAEHRSLDVSFNQASGDEAKFEVLRQVGESLWNMCEDGEYGPVANIVIDEDMIPSLPTEFIRLLEKTSETPDPAQLDDAIWEQWDKRAEALGYTFDETGHLVPIGQ